LFEGLIKDLRERNQL